MIAGAAQLGFYPVFRALVPDATDPFWARFAMATAAFVNAAAPWSERGRYRALVVQVYGLVSWVIWVCAANGYEVTYQVGGMLTIGAGLAVLRDWRETAALTTASAGLLLATLAAGADPHGWLLLASGVVLGTVAGMSTRRRNLLEDALGRSHRTLEDRVEARTLELHRRTTELEIEARERRAAEECALTASRAKSVFLASMSHELRTPLTAILGYAELVIEEPDDPAAVTADAQHIRTAGTHLLRLVDQVLDLARIEAGRLEVRRHPVAVRPLLAEVVATVTPLAHRRGNALSIEVTPGAGALTSDPDRVRQILVNLAANAATFTERGHIALRVWPEGSSIRFDVTDDGPGIPTDQQRTTFERFRPGAGGGSGLGLAISKDLAELLGGSLSMDSAVGRGTTFTLRLPADAT